MILPDINKPLLPEHVRYLSFEGGGGKGAAYLGVLIALLRPEFNVFKKGENDLTYLSDAILGIAGTSAGGITAALLGAGVPLEELIAMTLNISPSKDPSIDEYRNKAILEAFMDFDYKENYAIVPNLFEKNGYSKRSVTIVNQMLKAGISLANFSPGLEGQLKLLLEFYLKKQDLPASEDLFSIFERILNDDGIVPGVVMYRHIQYLINKYNKIEKSINSPSTQNQNYYLNYMYPDELNVGKKQNYEPPGGPPPGLTFEGAKQKYKREIIITGTNLSRGQVTYFSDALTPRLSIAAAARISASIPLIFKPIKFVEADLKYTGFTEAEIDILCGTWADGGVINNHPFHVFDVDKSSILAINYVSDSPKKLNPLLLPVVLDDLEPDIYNQSKISRKLSIDGLFPQLKTVLKVMLENATQAQYKNELEKIRTLKIATEVDDAELKTEVFNASPQTIIKVANQAVIKTLMHFGMNKNQHPCKVPDEIPVGNKMKQLLKEFGKFLTILIFTIMTLSCGSIPKASEIIENRPELKERSDYYFYNDSNLYIDYNDALLIETMFDKRDIYLKNPYIRIKVTNPDIKYYYKQIDSVIALLKVIGYGTANIEPLIVSYSYVTPLGTSLTASNKSYNYFVQSYLDTVQWLADADKYMRERGLKGMVPSPWGMGENIRFEFGNEYFDFVEKFKNDSVIFIQFELSEKKNISYYEYLNRPKNMLFFPDTHDLWENRKNK